jgi:maltose alpha-D-glucosyltransferase/alpha-amylase
VHVRAFFDSNNDGIGDFRGLTAQLDYIHDLGVNALWLLPFCPSPGRDDGYDIADYRGVHPQYGTLGDFRLFVREAHRRGLRVITELVVNHTSDQHSWFQAARRAPPGSVKRNYYVWSDDPTRYAGTRIIFTDTESSNWAWDPLAQAYYWHRFFSHQPDLNFDNPHVRKALLRVLRFWLDQGVDGLRLDAIPYLCEREGTSNENLPETHAVVKEIRAAIDAHYSDRMLLAEANQWPEDVRDYFGDGDECHMAFHFPLMPRIYMAIAQEDRHPIVEIMLQTPEIPAACQWAIFLRNHDELTLEMVTSKERDYMYQMYAADPRARINLGIRRRLAPLMENDPERIRLMNSLLLSMPGSPIIYYGDEIGMGDNIFLGDRNGVRTPMQWSPDRNAGFSRADPQQLYLPPIMDPIYGFQAVNVESQQREPSSLLNWMKRMLRVRNSSRAFGRGTLKFIRPGNRKILVYIREHADDTILCVANLARTAQAVELDLRDYKGRVPVELIGRTPFPPIGELPYLLTLSGYSFYWFRLASGEAVPSWHEERLPRDQLPVLVVFEGWRSFFRDRVVASRSGMAERVRMQLEIEALPEFIAAQRWFAAKGSRIRRAAIRDHGEWQVGDSTWLITLTRVEGDEQAADYFLPLGMGWEDGDETRYRAMQPVAVAKIRQQARVGLLGDALAADSFCQAIVRAIGAREELALAQGRLRFTPTSAYADHVAGAPEELGIKPLPSQGSNTTARLGDLLLLKAYRRLRPGENPELEVGRFLTERVKFEHCVPVLGSFEYVAADGERTTLGLLQPFVLNQGDAWTYTIEYLSRFFGSTSGAATPPPDAHGGYLALIDTLARRTAELHLALATVTGNPAFDPEPATSTDVAEWRDSAARDAATALDLLAERMAVLPEATRTPAQAVLERRQSLLDRLRAPGGHSRSLKTRYHGDFHLGQVLIRRNDFVIIDFEGEPGRSLEERRTKHSPLRDVAGMLRSFSYARFTALRAPSEHPRDYEAVAPLAQAWEEETRRRFLDSYLGTASAGGLLVDPDSARALLELFELEKAFYELRYELANRPDWVGIPLSGLLSSGAAKPGP